MPWAKIDDGFPDHPKTLKVPPQAYGLALAIEVLGLCYSNRYLTDGFLPEHVVSGFITRLSAPQELPSIMTDAGLWDRTEGGYILHDYLDYNPSKKEVMALRKKRQAAGRQGGKATAKHFAKQVARPVLKPPPLPSPPGPAPERESSPVGDEAAASQSGRNGFADWPPEWEPIKARIQTMPFLTRYARWLQDLPYWQSEDEQFRGVPATLDDLLTAAAGFCERDGYVPRSKRGIRKKLHNCMEFEAKRVEREKQRQS